MWAAREALLAEVRANRALIVVGETGSGKTTQIPRLLLEVCFMFCCLLFLSSVAHRSRWAPPQANRPVWRDVLFLK